jgi:hypothetical protein
MTAVHLKICEAVVINVDFVLKNTCSLKIYQTVLAASLPKCYSFPVWEEVEVALGCTEMRVGEQMNNAHINKHIY